MNIDAISSPLRVAGIGAAALIISLFLPWYGASVEGFGVDATATAWQSFALIDVILFLSAGAVLLVVWMVGDGRQASLPLPPSTLVAALGGLVVIFVLYRFLNVPLDDVDRRYGLFLGLASAAAVAIAGWVSMREHHETFGEARDQVSARVGEARSQAAQAIEGDEARHEDKTREELYEEAQRRGIEGRSEMSKEELAAALRRGR